MSEVAADAGRVPLEGGIVAEGWASAHAHADAGRPHLVLVHGAFAGSWCWELCAPWLASHGWTSTAGNWRGHHLSLPLESDALAALTIDDLVADLDVVVRSVDGPYVLVAHSIGSLVALAHAADSSSPPLALVLIAPAPPAGSEPGYEAGPPRDHSAPVPAPAAAVAGALFFNGLDDDLLERYAGLLSAESPTMLDEVTAGRPVDRARLGMPTLVISGGADALQPGSAIDRGVAAWAGGALEVVDNGGHFMIVEPGAWRTVAETVNSFLTKVLLASPADAAIDEGGE